MPLFFIQKHESEYLAAISNKLWHFALFLYEWYIFKGKMPEKCLTHPGIHPNIRPPLKRPYRLEA